MCCGVTVAATVPGQHKGTKYWISQIGDWKKNTLSSITDQKTLLYNKTMILPSLHDSMKLTASAVVICSITTFSCGSFWIKGLKTVSIKTFSRSNISTSGSVTSPWTYYHTQIIIVSKNDFYIFHICIEWDGDKEIKLPFIVILSSIIWLSKKAHSTRKFHHGQE